MTEVLNKLSEPEHFGTHHENSEALMCLTGGGECRILVELAKGYTPDEERQIIASITSALEAVDRFTSGKAGDIFKDLHIKIGEDISSGGGKALAEDNTVLLNGRKMLLSIAEMRKMSGAYDKDELSGFPDEYRKGSALEYTLVHEIGHILDGRTKDGKAYHRIIASESPTKYGGREFDERNNENKDHEAFAEGFAHLVWNMRVSETMEAIVRNTVSTRLEEVNV